MKKIKILSFILLLLINFLILSTLMGLGEENKDYPIALYEYDIIEDGVVKTVGVSKFLKVVYIKTK